MKIIQIVKTMEKEYLKKFERNIKEIFSNIPSLSIKKTLTNMQISDSFQADLIVVIAYNNKQKKIIVEIMSKGEPRYVRSAVQHLSSSLGEKPDVYGVICAPYISKRTGEICEASNIGYIDLSGNCSISFNNVYIKKENYKSVFSERKEAKSLFAKKTSRLLRVFLNNPEKTWTQLELAKEANVSIGLTNRVIKRLFDLEYVSFEKNKRITFKNPSALLDSWREEYSYLDNDIIGCFTSLSKEAFENRLSGYTEKRKQEKYALSLFSGASIVAPFVQSNQSFFYFLGNMEDLAETVELKPVSTGANALMLIPYDDGVFYAAQKLRNRNVVSNIQLYLDLYNYKGRGKEQAEYLREKVIGF